MDPALIGATLAIVINMIGLFAWLRSDIRAVERRLSADIHGVGERLSTNIRSAEERLGARMDRLETRMDRFETRMDAFDSRFRGLEQAVAELSGHMSMVGDFIMGRNQLQKTAGN